VREYIYLPETEIAPTRDARTRVDRPLAVVNAVNTATPATWTVHVDHLNRPVRMTDAAKAAVWDAVWLPWGGVHSITGTATLDARLPGQWFQLETGLHYNWHRQYDPTEGRYTQPDPLGFVDGPSVFAYARGAPQGLVDPDGRAVVQLCFLNPAACIKGGMTVVNICRAAVVAMAATGNVADTQIVQDWANDADRNKYADRCAWLAANADRYRPDQVKRTEKAWGCRRSRHNRE
jgi:RHS repeat-associated protein